MVVALTNCSWNYHTITHVQKLIGTITVCACHAFVAFYNAVSELTASHKFVYCTMHMQCTCYLSLLTAN